MTAKNSYVQIVRKSNDLVEAKYKFDVWETRVFTKTLTMIHLNDEDFKNYRIYLSDMVKDFGLENNKESYEWLKQGARGLMRKIITIVRDVDGIEMELEVPITIGVDKPLKYHTEDELRFIDLSFHPEMKPLLLQLKGRFTTYDVRNVLKLPSTYSIRMYELLKQYEKIKHRTIELIELKEMVGAIEKVEGKRGKIELLDHYPRFGNFKQRVLLKAQKDLLKFTDIKFTFELIKKGRKVDKIKFLILSNKPQREDNKKNIIEKINSNIYEQIEPIIENWKIYPDKELIKSLLRSNKTEHHIREAVTYIQNRIETGKKIDNPIAYFVKIVNEVSKQGDLFDPIKEQKKQIKDKKEKHEQRKIEAEKLKKKIIKLNNQARKMETDIIQNFVNENPEITDKVYLDAKEHQRSGYNPKKSEKENETNSIFQAYIRRKFKTYCIDDLKEVEKLFEKAEELKTQLQKI